MPHSPSEIRQFTHALRSPQLALAAIEQLRGCQEIAAIEGLVELILSPHSAKFATAAIAALEDCSHPLVFDALTHALRSEHITVRLSAVQALHIRNTSRTDDAVHHLLRRDEFWLVRRAALRLLADRAEPICWHIMDASDDPHWRVRHALIRVLLAWGEDAQKRRVIMERYASLPSPPAPLPEGEGRKNVRREGVAAYLRYRWTGNIADVFAPSFQFPLPQLWDWDVAVLLRNLERLSDAGRRRAMDAMLILLEHQEERIRNIAVDSLRTGGSVRDIAEAIRWLDDLRLGAGDAVQRLLHAQHQDRMEAIAHCIFALTDPSPAQRAWALAQIGPIVPVEDVAAQVLLWRTPAADRETTATDASHVHGASDSPMIRAAALTPERAAELVRDPLQETSWHVLAEAARIAKVPFWKLEPTEPWQPPKHLPEAPTSLSLHRADTPLARQLGPEALNVCPLGISGHYGLPVEGFVRAYEAGVNLMFWEPNYHTMTTFYRRLAPADLRSIHLIAGTFEADGTRIQRDVEQILRRLHIDRIAIFLLFWVQTWQRIAPDVRAVLQRMQGEGKIATYGLSTHNRILAVEAMELGWNPVMVRHSAAHRGAEERIVPKATELGTSLITFNNTCYGRLLQPQSDLQPPSAADCYRYTLSMPPVRGCLSAPATLEHLEENLNVLADPDLPQERRRSMLQFGAALYREETTFRKLVRAL